MQEYKTRTAISWWPAQENNTLYTREHKGQVTAYLLTTDASVEPCAVAG